MRTFFHKYFSYIILLCFIAFSLCSREVSALIYQPGTSVDDTIPTDTTPDALTPDAGNFTVGSSADNTPLIIRSCESPDGYIAGAWSYPVNETSMDDITVCLPLTAVVSENVDFSESSDDQLHVVPVEWDIFSCPELIDLSSCGVYKLTGTVLLDDNMSGTSVQWYYYVSIQQSGHPMINCFYFEDPFLLFPWLDYDPETDGELKIYLSENDGEYQLLTADADSDTVIPASEGLYLDQSFFQNGSCYKIYSELSGIRTEILSFQYNRDNCPQNFITGDRDGGDSHPPLENIRPTAPQPDHTEAGSQSSGRSASYTRDELELISRQNQLQFEDNGIVVQVPDTFVSGMSETDTLNVTIDHPSRNTYHLSLAVNGSEVPTGSLSVTIPLHDTINQDITLSNASGECVTASAIDESTQTAQFSLPESGTWISDGHGPDDADSDSAGSNLSHDTRRRLPMLIVSGLTLLSIAVAAGIFMFRRRRTHV